MTAGVFPTPFSPLQSLAGALAATFGERLSLSLAVREAHGVNEAFHPPAPPDLVVFPKTTEEVALVVRTCADLGLPVIAYGAGTSLEGGPAAVQGGCCIDLSLMDQILAVHAEDMDCVVQAGVTREQLNLHLRDSGLFFPIDPGANATLGGMSATRASGTNAVRYGTMKDNVLSLQVILADGTIIETANRARKSAAGYDLTSLFLGSEGTLGVITAVTLRLHGRPEAVAVAVAPFQTLASAVDCVVSVMQSGLPMARIELMDGTQVAACNAFAHSDLTVTPTLFLEFHGSPNAVAEQVTLVREIAEAHGALDFREATEQAEREALWRSRHQALYAAKALRPGGEVLVTDVCVPLSELVACIVDTHAQLNAAGLVAPIVGHVGDGNFHVFMVLDPADSHEVAAVRRVNDWIVDRAIRAGGTCTGEHGIGLGKREKLVAERGVAAVGVMRSIKSILDPLNLMNPGKVFLS